MTRKTINVLVLEAVNWWRNPATSADKIITGKLTDGHDRCMTEKSAEFNGAKAAVDP